MLTYFSFQNYNSISPIDSVYKNENKPTPADDAVDTPIINENHLTEVEPQIKSQNKANDSVIEKKTSSNTSPGKIASYGDADSNTDGMTDATDVMTASDTTENSIPTEKKDSIENNPIPVPENSVSMKKDVTNEQNVCGKQISPDNTSSEETEIKELKEKINYIIKTPQYIPSEYKLKNACITDDEIIEIRYESDSDTICYSTTKYGDINKDCDACFDIETITIKNYDVSIKGNEGVYYSANWTENEEKYCVNSLNGLEKTTMIEIVENVSY